MADQHSREDGGGLPVERPGGYQREGRTRPQARAPRLDLSLHRGSLEAALLERIPERNLLDILANVPHWTPWTTHFGPLFGLTAM